MVITMLNALELDDRNSLRHRRKEMKVFSSKVPTLFT